MPLATTEQYGAMLDAASAGGWALPSINVTSSQTLIGVLQGFAEAGSDGLVQVTTGGGAYLSGDRTGEEARGAAAIAAFAHEVAPAYDTLIALHTDHCTPDLADRFLGPLLARTADRRAAGLPPLFHSHMFDGSTLPLAENLRLSAQWLERCAALDVVLEIECGVVGGEEDGVRGDAPGSERLYTTPEELLEVAATLGTGERGRYLLAATFGNVHGVYAPGNVQLRPTVLRDGQEALARARPGARRFEYVFHGSSGTAPEQLRETIGYGVVKVNVDTEMQHAFTGGVVAHVQENADVIGSLDGPEAKKAFDPRTWGRRGQRALADRVVAECETLGSAGRSLA
ncbi:MAG TPA: class II fructose-bisphosphate aldolase [Baekduia sp.]|jgi:fructose-bisphosphate aldolase class II